MANILDVNRPVVQDDSIYRYQYHIVAPQTGTSLEHNGEIILEISNKNLYTLPSESFILLTGTFKTTNGGQTTNSRLNNNAFAFLFEDIRYSLNGVEIDKTNKLGIATTIKNYVSVGSCDMPSMVAAGWDPLGKHSSRVSTDARFFCMSTFEKITRIRRRL